MSAPNSSVGCYWWSWHLSLVRNNPSGSQTLISPSLWPSNTKGQKKNLPKFLFWALCICLTFGNGGHLLPTIHHWCVWYDLFIVPFEKVVCFGGGGNPCQWKQALSTSSLKALLDESSRLGSGIISTIGSWLASVTLNIKMVFLHRWSSICNKRGTRNNVNREQFYCLHLQGNSDNKT